MALSGHAAHCCEQDRLQLEIRTRGLRGPRSVNLVATLPGSWHAQSTRDAVYSGGRYGQLHRRLRPSRRAAAHLGRSGLAPRSRAYMARWWASDTTPVLRGRHAVARAGQYRRAIGSRAPASACAQRLRDSATPWSQARNDPIAHAPATHVMTGRTPTKTCPSWAVCSGARHPMARDGPSDWQAAVRTDPDLVTPSATATATRLPRRSHAASAGRRPDSRAPGGCRPVGTPRRRPSADRRRSAAPEN